jgi:Sigma-54 interaction domain
MYTRVYMIAERALFQRIAAMVAANPFGEPRRALERTLGGSDKRASSDEVFARSLVRAEEAVRTFKGRRRSNQSTLDREAMDLSALYVVFHRFAGELDRHIAQQQASATLLRPAFVRDLLGALDSYDLAGDGAEERVALIFQMRRAYVFIDRAVTGVSRPVQLVREALWNNIFTCDLKLYAGKLKSRMEDFSTLLLGQTGTGKGAAASAIGMAGYIPWDAKSGLFRENFARTFLALNLSEYSETLIESELFGHEKGAFTGAIQQRAGAFERCSAYGSVFLYEIGELNPAIQVKLLRVLEARQFTPVGGTESRRFSGRTIAATHQSLESLRTEGRMRHDFYYRLCSDRILLPTLRERLDADASELGHLVNSIVIRLLGESSAVPVEQTLYAISKHLPVDYPWPGNVRELEQCVRSVLLTRAYPGDPLAYTSTPARNDKQAQRARAAALYRETQNYGAVARTLGIDRRTAKKYASE